MKGVGVLRKLKVLYMSNNLVKDWAEFNKLQECPSLVDLLFVGKLKKLKPLDFSIKYYHLSITA